MRAERYGAHETTLASSIMHKQLLHLQDLRLPSRSSAAAPHMDTTDHTRHVIHLSTTGLGIALMPPAKDQFKGKELPSEESMEEVSGPPGPSLSSGSGQGSISSPSTAIASNMDRLLSEDGVESLTPSDAAPVLATLLQVLPPSAHTPTVLPDGSNMRRVRTALRSVDAVAGGQPRLCCEARPGLSGASPHISHHLSHHPPQKTTPPPITRDNLCSLHDSFDSVPQCFEVLAVIATEERLRPTVARLLFATPSIYLSTAWLRILTFAHPRACGPAELHRLLTCYKVGIAGAILLSPSC